MHENQTTSSTLMRACAGMLLAASLACGSLGACAASSSGSQQPSDEAAASEDVSSETTETETGEEAVEEGAQDEASFASWADEATDRHGDATAYAVAELKGWQLETLLQQQGYAWSERNQMWTKEDGSAAVVVLDKEGKTVSDDDIAELEEGASEATVSYRIVSSGYSNAKRAFEGLASNVLDCEDFEIVEDSAVGVLSGPSEKRCLVIVSKSNDVFVATVMSEGAVASGLLEGLVGQPMGETIDEAFELMAGRAPGSVTN